MASLSRLFKRIFGVCKLTPQPIGPDLSRFAEGDRVLVDGKKLSGPLHKNHRLELPRGYISHNDILGKSPRALIPTNSGQKYRITYPDFDQYIALTPRRVTPVYASYANLIVSLLDIHVAAPTLSNEHDTPLEILEAGTGHGALTLHLARTIHAANPPPPFLPPPSFDATPSPSKGNEPKETETAEGEDQAAWLTYLTTRRAIIHSVELSPTYSAHAQKLVRGFRHGIYAPHIDFHIASIDAWISSQRSERRASRRSGLFTIKSSGSPESNPFLSYAILDMPASYLQIEHVASVMKAGALLVVFVPSVTQIGDCVRIIRDRGLRLQMEKVVELGEGVSNGRVWDVRLATRRKGTTKGNRNVDVSTEKDAATEQTEELNSNVNAGSASTEGEAEVDEDDSVMVCRPKVGRMTIGGGFIGLWRKMDCDSATSESRDETSPRRQK